MACTVARRVRFLFQYGLWQLGHAFGSLGPRITHSYWHRVHFRTRLRIDVMPASYY
jgi:hypothetical protein